MNNLCCWLVTCRPGNSVLVAVVKRPIWPAHAAARGRRANAYVAGRTKPAVGLAQPWVSPTGHPLVSPTGHQSCRGRQHAVPLDEAAIRHIHNSSMALDVYCWLAYRLPSLTADKPISWAALAGQFGGGIRLMK